MTPMTSPTLRARLDAAARFDAEYGASLSNHLPMTLTALARLGADDERLAEFVAHYVPRLHDAPPTEPWSAGDPWREWLGDPRAWPTYRALFRDWLAYEDAEPMLAQVLPVLMQGVGATAFHGLIRAAYALAAQHAGELADALAYWACRWFRCGASAGVGDVADPARVLVLLEAVEVPERPLISQSMALAAADPRVASALARLHVDRHTTLPRLAQLAAERYAAQGGFTTLHLVTSAQALHALLRFIDTDDQRAALANYALAYGAAWATLGPTSASPAAPLELLPWPELVARAVESDDEHVIKLVDSCREQERSYGGAVWARAASRVVAQGV